MLWWLFCTMKQPCVYTHPLPLKTSHPPPQPFPLGHHRALK